MCRQCWKYQIWHIKTVNPYNALVISYQNTRLIEWAQNFGTTTPTTLVHTAHLMPYCNPARLSKLSDVLCYSAADSERRVEEGGMEGEVSLVCIFGRTHRPPYINIFISSFIKRRGMARHNQPSAGPAIKGVRQKQPLVYIVYTHPTHTHTHTHTHTYIFIYNKYIYIRPCERKLGVSEFYI